MTILPPWLLDEDGVGRSWKESVKHGDQYFPGNLDDVDGSLTVSRRPMMDAYCNFFRKGSNRCNVMQGLRTRAAKRAGEICIRYGYNAVYYEEFEFFVDKLIWERFFGRWGRTNTLRWPWRTSVNSLKAGGLSFTYDRLLQASRQDDVPSSTHMEQKSASGKATVSQDESQRKRPWPSSCNRVSIPALSEGAGGSDTGSGRTTPADDRLTQVSYEQLQERLASINARLLQIEAYPRDKGPSPSRPTIPSAPEHVPRNMCDESLDAMIEAAAKRRKRSEN